MTPTNLFLIDYGHIRDGVLYHGTVSYTDGVIQSTWTYEQDGQKVTRPGQISDESFRLLWDAVSGGGVFARCHMTDPNAAMDPIKFHIIAIAFRTDGSNGMRTFRVPITESDPEFLGWLSALAVPNENVA